MPDPGRGQVGCGRREVVDERTREEVSVLVPDVALEERGGGAVGEPAAHLTLGEQRVQEAARVVHRHVVENPDLAGVAIDLDDRDVGNEAVGRGGSNAGRRRPAEGDSAPRSTP